MSKDYYKMLGVEKVATQEDIKKAFRKKAHQYHPDKQGGDEQKFKEVNEAYQVLGDKQKRSQYDQFGTAFQGGQDPGAYGGFQGGSGFSVNMDDLGDIFEGFGDIFGFGSSRSRGAQTSRRRGRDIQTFLTIEFSEAVFGIEREVNLEKNITCDRCKGNSAEPGSKIETCKACGGSGQTARMQRTILGDMQVQTTCTECKGEGKTYSKLCVKCSGSGVVKEKTNLKVNIPAGIDNNETIRLSGQGEAGEKGAPAGDLFIKIRVKEDKRFERDGDIIQSSVRISVKQAALGDKIEIISVDGPIKLKIPAGTQSGTVFKLRNKGVPSLNGGRRGDHLVTVKVDIPKRLNRKQRQLLEDLDI